MMHRLSPEKREQYKNFIQFASDALIDHASLWEEEEAIPREVVAACASAGYLGAMLPSEYRGMGWDAVTYGLLNEAIGAASVSLSGLVNVHTMVSQTLLKWGTSQQKQRWLSALATGQVLAAFALTEPGAGSDIENIATMYTRDGEDLLVTGVKKWITCAGVADLFLVFGKLDGLAVAALIERDTPGLNVTPIRHMLGFRAAHLATLELKDCRISSDQLVGKPGFALSYIAPYALDYGRISVAFAALGILRLCLEICGQYVLERVAFNVRLIDHSVISAMITDMGVDLEAASLLCMDAVQAKDAHQPEATEKIMIAKYFTTRAAARHTSQAVQIMGALGCHEDFPIARCYRDAKTMEIIEGSNQIQQFLLGKSFARDQKKKRTMPRLQG